jgi:Asp/Glu/hydantoin racemase
VSVLIAVWLPDWWEKLAIDRYRIHAGSSTRLIGGALSEEQQAKADAGSLLEVLVANAQRAESEGAMAHIIDCFGDPVLQEMSSRIQRPAIGVGLAGMHFAYAFSRAFAVITSEAEGIDGIVENAGRYGVAGRLSRCRAIGIPAAEIPDRRTEVLDALEREASGIAADVDMIVMGCTELAEMAGDLQSRLAREGRRVRVINPLIPAVRWAEALAAAVE